MANWMIDAVYINATDDGEAHVHVTKLAADLLEQAGKLAPTPTVEREAA